MNLNTVSERELLEEVQRRIKDGRILAASGVVEVFGKTKQHISQLTSVGRLPSYPLVQLAIIRSDASEFFEGDGLKFKRSL